MFVKKMAPKRKLEVEGRTSVAETALQLLAGGVSSGDSDGTVGFLKNYGGATDSELVSKVIDYVVDEWRSGRELPKQFVSFVGSVYEQAIGLFRRRQSLPDRGTLAFVPFVPSDADKASTALIKSVIESAVQTEGSKIVANHVVDAERKWMDDNVPEIAASGSRLPLVQLYNQQTKKLKLLVDKDNARMQTFVESIAAINKDGGRRLGVVVRTLRGRQQIVTKRVKKVTVVATELLVKFTQSLVSMDVAEEVAGQAVGVTPMLTDVSMTDNPVSSAKATDAAMEARAAAEQAQYERLRNEEVARESLARVNEQAAKLQKQADEMRVQLAASEMQVREAKDMRDRVESDKKLWEEQAAVQVAQQTQVLNVAKQHLDNQAAEIARQKDELTREEADMRAAAAADHAKLKADMEEFKKSKLKLKKKEEAFKRLVNATNKERAANERYRKELDAKQQVIDQQATELQADQVVTAMEIVDTSVRVPAWLADVTGLTDAAAAVLAIDPTNGLTAMNTYLQKAKNGFGLLDEEERRFMAFFKVAAIERIKELAPVIMRHDALLAAMIGANEAEWNDLTKQAALSVRENQATLVRMMSELKAAVAEYEMQWEAFKVDNDVKLHHHLLLIDQLQEGVKFILNIVDMLGNLAVVGYNSLVNSESRMAVVRLVNQAVAYMRNDPMEVDDELPLSSDSPQWRITVSGLVRKLKELRNMKMPEFDKEKAAQYLKVGVATATVLPALALTYSKLCM